MEMESDNMRFLVERIEDDIASLENMETGDITNFNISEIPFKILEGDVLIFENDTWSQDFEEKEETHERIKNKMDDLWE